MKAEELAVIKERASTPLIGELSRTMDYMAESRQDIKKLVAEVERLREAIDNAISLLADGENRIANRYLCDALGVHEDYYGFYSGVEGE